MIDVRNVSSQLEQMSDQHLQQYAQMHREDPYTLALAISESSRRKRMRQAAQAQQPAGAGTVADEAVAEMTPPAAGLMGAADAVLPPTQGFADGGGVSQFVQDIRALPERYQKWWEENRRKDAERAAEDAASAERQEAIDAARSKASFGNYLFGTPEREVEGRAELEQLLGSKTPTNPNYGNEGRRESGFWGPTATPPAPEAGLGAAARSVTPPATAPAAPAGGSSGLSAASRSSGARADAGAPKLDTDVNAAYADVEKQLRAATDAERRGGEQDLADETARQVARGKLGAGREERFKAEQDGMAAKEAQAKRDALVQAGLAILAADPSKGAWSAIGSGALQGFQGYKGDMASLAKRREELLIKMDELEDLRRQEANADGKELAAIRSRIRRAEVDGAKALAAIGGEKAKTSMELKVTAFKETMANWRSDRENATRLSAARIGASGGGGGSGAQDRSQRDADAAFARDPEVAVLQKRLENPFMLQPGEEAAALRRLRQIQDNTYKQYGVKLQGGPAAAGASSGGWGPAKVIP